ncbi:flagellar biosynthesis protein FlhF [Denitratisoma oestradiolicum]|uniref:Flagellar biosynthesis protein FlhF n=1 Tax=Denitratisoma oestradiolicum TaxID=311182 RepID=A0A6S6Y581_9PROT|nr:flagellar biosynthesis protein FlhF [Denitratisoma oestradiolicum]TWO81610.1 flagellar biosynthesis protein FlhF [Denitratisoma oestradiolicum]CAB1370550.1 Flagellar biosynthesis protein FlhF [Denitratisoma oestradiolicum]
MTIKRFYAETARECLRKVKDDLGPDAIVVSNKAVEGGVEITAMSADSLDALSRQATTELPARSVANGVPMEYSVPSPATDDDYTVSLSTQARKQPAFRTWEPQGDADRPRLRPLPPREPRQDASAGNGTGAPSPAPEVKSPVPRQIQSAPRSDSDSSDAKVSLLMQEMQVIKGMLEQQLAGFAWGDLSKNAPVRALLLSEMLEAGFSGQLARRMTQELPADVGIDEGRKRLMAGLNRRLRTLGNEGDLIDKGGVYALVGPTGVGKTTSTAKLAARCVVRYGADRVALLTTDSYRIGAHEQLRIYGRILGVPVHIVRDGEDLRHTLSDLRDKHMVLIDTVGMSQRDRMVADQAAMLTRAGEVNRLLLLNATSRGDTLDDVIRAYAGEDLAGCLLTKVDEAASLAPAIDALVRHGLLLAYMANGQRVPEDMHLPNRSYLLHRAFKQPPAVSPHRLQENEVGMALTRQQSVPASSENHLV